MIVKYNKAFLQITITLFLFFNYVMPAQSETSSRVAPSSSNIQLKDVQAAADKINKEKYDHYLSDLNELAKDPGVMAASMLLAYDGDFFKDESYKIMTIFYFGNNETRVDEYYPVKKI